MQLDQPLYIVQIAKQYFEELKITGLSYKLSLYKNRNAALEAIQSPSILFTSLQTSALHLKQLVDIIKDLELENKRLWRNILSLCL